jgi:integrase
MEKWEEYLELYLKHKKSLRLAPRTIDDARYHVTNLFKDKSVDFSDFRALKNLIIEYFADSDHISPVTYNTRRKNLNTFFNWLVAEEYIPKSPMNSIKKTREGHKPRHISSDIILNYLDACDLSTYNGLRNYICIALSYDTGIRPS